MIGLVFRSEGATFALLIDTSRLWANYRHTANVLSVHSIVRQMGIPSHRISLLIPGDIECNPRNPIPGEVFHTPSFNLYTHVRSSYKGDEISRESISRLLSGRHSPHTPRSQRLLTRGDSKLFIFLTGHSGIGFAKLQDTEEFYAVEIAELFDEMQKKERYKKMLWVGDTCRAASLHEEFYSENIVAVGSSGNRESSYSRHRIDDLGISVVDRFSYSAELFLRRHIVSRFELGMSVRFFASAANFPRRDLLSDITLRTDLSQLSDGGTLIDYIGDADTMSKNRDFKIGHWSFKVRTIKDPPQKVRQVESFYRSRDPSSYYDHPLTGNNKSPVQSQYWIGVTVIPFLALFARYSF